MAHLLRRAALVTTLVVALTACGGDDAGDEPAVTAAVTDTTAAAPTTGAGTGTDVTTPPPSAPSPTEAPGTTVPEATLIDIADERVAFTLALPETQAVAASGIDDFVGDGSCTYYWWRLTGGAVVEAWPASCDPANSEPGNGSYGHYRTLADAPALVPAGAVETVLGPATLGEQVYYECTNSCDEWALDLAVIELSEPVDPEYPTVAVIMTDREAGVSDLLALLEAFGAG